MSFDDFFEGLMVAFPGFADQFLLVQFSLPKTTTVLAYCGSPSGFPTRLDKIGNRLIPNDYSTSVLYKTRNEENETSLFQRLYILRKEENQELYRPIIRKRKVKRLFPFFE